MRERQEFVDRYFVFADSEYQPPVDYSRTRGLIGEIFKEIVELDTERKLLAEAAERPVPTHEPRAPVGRAPERARAAGEGDFGADGAPEPPQEAAPPQIVEPPSEPGVE
mgnify:CR=1 FL=1